MVKNILLCCLCALICTACYETEADPNVAVPYTVSSSVLQGTEVRLTQELPGRVSPLTISEVRPQVTGIVQKRLFEEGADVKAGDVLYKIDPALFQAAYNSAQANLERVEANLVSAELLSNRYDKLLATNGVSKQDHADARAQYLQAKAEVMAAREALETAKINLGYTNVTAPISGRIGRSFVTPGALVTQNQPNALATIQELDNVYVDVTQSSAELLRLQRDFKAGKLRSSGKNAALVHLMLEDGTPYVRNPDYQAKGEKPQYIEGELLFSDVTVEQSTGTVNLRARFENVDNTLLPGMYARAVVEEGVRDEAILIPQASLLYTTKGEPYVYVLSKTNEAPVQNAQAEVKKQLNDNEYYVVSRSVVVDRDYKNQWLISSGLAKDERLVLNGFQRIHAGDIVIAEDNVASTAVAEVKQNEQANS